MADDDWFGGGDDDAPQAPLKPLVKKGQQVAAPDAEKEPQASEEAPAEAAEEPVPEAEDEYLDPDKLLLFKHWIRPKFLPYKYLYIYRRNYYDDVMDYLDKRSKGISRDIPKAQTWAERILRTFSNKVVSEAVHKKISRNDFELIEKTKTSGNSYFYHVKTNFNRRFSPLLF